MTSLQSAPPRHGRSIRPMRIAVLGTRGPHADSGDLETAVEEIGQRLVEQGHQVTVYGRSTDGPSPKQHLGMRVVTLPALRSRAHETLSHTALAAAHLQVGRRYDVAFVFDAANAPLVPLIRSRGTAVAVHVDAPAWKRDTWGRLGLQYSRAAEQLAVREADALIADAHSTQDRYADEFAIPTELIRYGTKLVEHSPADLIEPLGLVPGGYHLAVARFEPEDHIDVIVEGYHRSDARLPLVVVGQAPWSAGSTERIERLAARDPRIRLQGCVRDQRMLDQLYAHALSSVHGLSVGGANLSLLRAMGAGTAVVAWDGVVNREVAGTAGSYFSSPSGLARQVEEVERYPFRFRDIGELMQDRAGRFFDWDVVAEQYEALASKLARGYSTRGMSTGRRLDAAWSSVGAEVEVTRG